MCSISVDEMKVVERVVLSVDHKRYEVRIWKDSRGECSVGRLGPQGAVRWGFGDVTDHEVSDPSRWAISRP